MFIFKAQSFDFQPVLIQISFNKKFYSGVYNNSLSFQKSL